MSAVSALDGSRARRLDAAMDRFVAREAGRSIAVETLTSPFWRGGRDEGMVRPAASLLKVAVVIAVLRAANSGALQLDQEVARDALPASRFRSVIDVLDESHRFSLRELCGLALATSDNPVGQYLLDAVGRDAVNGLLLGLGCAHSRLGATFADADLGPSGRANVSTAADMSRLLRHVHDDETNRVILQAMQCSLQTTRIPLRMPDDGSVCVAHKTGSLAGVVNDAGIVYGDGVAMSVAVLCDAQRDPAATGMDIGECVIECWRTIKDCNW